VDDYCTVGDNIDADLGMAYNCTAPLDFMSFEKLLEIGKCVREIATVNRVIPFGGTGTTIDDILKAEETREDRFIGIHAVKSGSYKQGYQCLHLGYGVKEHVQAPTILTKAGIPVSLFGKVADVVINQGGKSVSCVNTSDVLDMTVEQALEFFEHQPRIYRRVMTLSEVGLGYITLGQHATTLSGGEAQRVKLAEELSKKDTGNTLYVLDEPTTGLHFQDVKLLLDVLQKLVDKGNTVLIIEHNLDVIKVSDYVIDMGPEGGNAGGTLIGSGTPEDIAKVKGSHTGRFLKTELK
jgi:ABC-type dipeptide/oligopeptide/nickel transport system ATPase component